MSLTERMAPRGAKKVCFQQFAATKDLEKFVADFWALDKRDQDSLVLQIIFSFLLLWVWKNTTCGLGSCPTLVSFPTCKV